MRLRRIMVPLTGIVLVLVGTLAFGDLNGNLVYYLTPSEASERRGEFDDGQRFRLAGVVAEDSIEPTADGATFVVEDARQRITVAHSGAPPQLFRADIEVVVEGHWRDDRFVSDLMLIKHDEQYQPPSDTGPST